MHLFPHLNHPWAPGRRRAQHVCALQARAETRPTDEVPETGCASALAIVTRFSCAWECAGRRSRARYGISRQPPGDHGDGRPDHGVNDAGSASGNRASSQTDDALLGDPSLRAPLSFTFHVQSLIGVVLRCTTLLSSSSTPSLTKQSNHGCPARPDEHCRLQQPCGRSRRGCEARGPGRCSSPQPEVRRGSRRQCARWTQPEPTLPHVGELVRRCISACCLAHFQ